MKYLASILLLSATLLASCSNDSSPNNNNTTTGTYMPATAGSSWFYHSYGDTLTRWVSGTYSFNGMAFAKIDDRLHTQYVRQSGVSYYGLYLDLLDFREVKIAESSTNASWQDTLIGNGFTQITTYKTVGTGLSATVNGKTYSDVMHVHVETASSGTSTASDFYYAKEIGEILDIESGDTVESLVSYTIK